MTEEDYEINRLFSWLFQLGFESVPFLHSILKTPSPNYDEHSTLRERKSRYVSDQERMSQGEVKGMRFRF